MLACLLILSYSFLSLNFAQIRCCRCSVSEIFQHFSELFNTPKAFTFLTLDDDVVRASSKKNSTKGYPITRIPNRKLGINVDGLGDPISGVLFGGFIDKYDRSLSDVIKSILLQLSKHTTMEDLFKDPDLGHILLMFDRGYFSEPEVELVTSTGANSGGTPKSHGRSNPVGI